MGRTVTTRCKFFWSDWDQCGLPLDHDGDHAVFGPKCGILSREGVPCDQEWCHSFGHRATIYWSRDA